MITSAINTVKIMMLFPCTDSIYELLHYCLNDYRISLIITRRVLIFSRKNPNILYINNATVQYHLRVHYYFYIYKQLYIIGFLLFNNINLAINRIQNNTIYCK